MVYNEEALLPIWARHYARQVGADQCYVVDHGSSGKISLPPGVNLLRIPRSPHDDERRAEFISEFARGLLRYYDWVIYTDVDELILADPQLYRDLPSFTASADVPQTVTAIGFDIQHVPALELPLDPDRPVGQQRGWARFTSAMCKPVLTTRPVTWSPGFHCCEYPPVFSHLYLFHLHWADLTVGLDRQRKTRAMPWAGDQFGNHQRVADADWLGLFGGMADLPRTREIVFDSEAPPLCSWLEKTVDSHLGRAEHMFNIDLGLNAAELWPIPPYFRAKL